jgi:mannose-6-phosphate isomerase-like protein (cupin superfamily)
VITVERAHRRIMSATVIPGPQLLSAHDITGLPVSPIGTLPGVERKILWREGSAEAGVLVVMGGHQLGVHTHRRNHHHLWVLDGHATILGHEVGPGSFVHVPVGVEHDIDARGTEGCAVFYVYAPTAG